MVTMKDVAREAGVSVGTVSNVLNRPDGVGTDVRLKVTMAIHRLGYVRDEAARQLRAGSSSSVASGIAVIADVTDPAVTDVIRGVDQAAEEIDAYLLVSHTAGSAQRERRQLARVSTKRVKGVILCAASVPVPPPHARDASGCPTVLVTPASSFPAWQSIGVNDFAGGQLVGRHLLGEGHQRVAVVEAGSPHPGVQGRLAGFGAALAHQGEVVVVPGADPTARGGSAAMAWICQRWPHRSQRPTAVFCMSDALATGVLIECMRRGITVPDEVAVVGYGDLPYLSDACIPLTSVRQPRAEIGRAAVELLAEPSRDGAPPNRRPLLLPPTLVVRASTGSRPPS